MSFLDRIRSLLRGDRPAPDRSHTPDPSPAFPTQPTIAQQVETLESLGLRLRDPLTVAAVEHTVARGVTPDQLTSTAGPGPVPPHVCAAYWWLLFETVGGRRAVDAVVTVDDPHAEHRSPSGKKLQASIELFLSRVCSLTGVDTPAVQVTSFTKGHNPFLHTAEVVVGDQHHSWTSGDRTALRPLLLRAAETPETALVDFSDHGAKSSNLFDVAALPRAHAPAFARLLEQFIAPTIRWRDEWVTAVRSSEDASHRAALIESDLPDDLRTAGLPAPEEVPRWTPEDPPTKLDALMATQERIDADWAEAIGAQQRTEDLSLDDRIDALARHGLDRNPDATEQELREDVDWPPQIDALAAALDRTDVTDAFARREEGEDEGILGLTVDGIPHEVPCAFEGKYLDLEALDALGDLLAPADREQVAVGDTLAWPLTEQAESFRKLVAGG